MRIDSRLPDQLRPIVITPNYLPHAEGSVLIAAGGTHVICAASVEDRVPPFRRNSGKGWITAEYGMLPRATHTRTTREARLARSAGAPRRSNASSAGRSDRWPGSISWASEPSGSTAMSSRPTAARGPPPSREASLRSSWRCSACARAADQEHSGAGLRGGHERRHHRRRADAGPGLRGRLARRRRHEHRADRRRPLHRAAGHGRGGPVRPRRPRCAVRPGRHGHPSARRVAARASSAGFSAGDGPAAVSGRHDERWKAARDSRLLAGLPIELVGLDRYPGIPPPHETGSTFAENARPEGPVLRRVTDLPSMADDSGLEIDAMEGRPGIESARFGGVDTTYPEKFELIYDTLRRVRRPESRPGLSVPSRSPTATRSPSRPAARSKAASPRGRPAQAASATTRSSITRRTAARSPRSRRNRRQP